MGPPRVISKTQHFDFNREHLYGDERMRFLLIKDTTQFKGLNLFKTFLKLYYSTDIKVALLCCDGPVEDLACGLNKDKTLVCDEFANSVTWSNELTFFGSYLEKLNGFEGLLCIYSLTSLLIQNSVDKIYVAVHKMLNDNPKLHILALMHSDVHSSRENEIMENLATSVIKASPEDGSTKFLMTTSTRNKAFGQILYEYQLSSSFTFETIKIASLKYNKIPTKKPDPTANLTFNLNLNEEEKEARNQLELPFTKIQSNESVVTQDLEDFYEEEDPDDDLGFLEAV